MLYARLANAIVGLWGQANSSNDRASRRAFSGARTSRASRAWPQSGADGPAAAMAVTLCDGAAECALVPSRPDAAGRRNIGGGRHLRRRLGCGGDIACIAEQ